MSHPWVRWWPRCDSCLFRLDGTDTPVCKGMPPDSSNRRKWLENGDLVASVCAPKRNACAVYIHRETLEPLIDYLRRKKVEDTDGAPYR